MVFYGIEKGSSFRTTQPFPFHRNTSACLGLIGKSAAAKRGSHRVSGDAMAAANRSMGKRPSARGQTIVRPWANGKVPVVWHPNRLPSLWCVGWLGDSRWQIVRLRITAAFGSAWPISTATFHGGTKARGEGRGLEIDSIFMWIST